ncbi:MAG TPA: hypothetical protein VIV82_08445 [Verrucomicrobiae bacterium]
MAFIYLHRLNYPEKNRVDPDDIWKIVPLDTDDGMGSIVTFKNQDALPYKESPREIEKMEYRMRYLWPNVERIVVAVIGGITGSLLTLLFKYFA